jgi:cytochrome c biogenesis protein
VFELDVKDLKQLNGRDLKAGGITLAPGSTYTLPDGKGSISFDGVKKYVGVDIHHNPGQLSALIFALLAVAGLVVSLYVNRRRVWVRTGTHEDGRTMVEYGLLARGEDHRLAGEAVAIRGLLADAWGLDSQKLPSERADNGPADAQPVDAAAEGAADAPAAMPSEDFIQSTAGSHESKKDQ